MNTQELQTVLEEAGLSPYQADAYVSLLELGTASATEVADASDVPQPRIYDVLEGLEERGYIELYDQGTLQVRAHDPTTVFEDLSTRASRFSAAATEVRERWQQPRPEEYTATVVKRFDTLLNRIVDVIESATVQVRLALTPAQFHDLEPALTAAHDRGASVHLVLYTHGESVELPETAVYEGVCTAVRHRPFPGQFVALVDPDFTGFAPIGNPPEYGMIVRDRSLAEVLYWFFEVDLWDTSEVVYEDSSKTLPVHFVNVRQCIRAIEPLLDDGAVIRVRVEGRNVATGTEVRLTGVIAELSYANRESETRRQAAARPAGRVSMTLDCESRTYTIGGWGASMEDVAATCVTIETIDGSDAVELC